MNLKLITCILILIAVPFSSHGGISKELWKTAGSDPGHVILMNHPWNEKLRNQDFEAKQVIQFLEDRVLILGTMEARALPAERGCGTALPQKIFRRSAAYKNALKTMAAYGESNGPSEAAKAYAQFLENEDPQIVAIHLWTFLTGQTLGVQITSGHFKQKFPEIGTTLEDFGVDSVNKGNEVKIDWAKIRNSINAWLDETLGTPSFDASAQVSSAYSYTKPILDANVNAPALLPQQARWPRTSSFCQWLMGYPGKDTEKYAATVRKVL